MTGIAIWIPAAILAGALQAWRTAVQRKVGRDLSVNAAGLVRYLYGLPFALGLLAAYQWLAAAAPLPALSGGFLFFCAAGGTAQIVATNFLLLSFKSRGFVAGTAFSKTEALQAALLGFLLLHERLPAQAWAGIGLGIGGVVLLGLPARSKAAASEAGPAWTGALYGILAGSFFALTALGIRRATLDLHGGDAVQSALLALAVTVAMQTVLQGSYVALRERDQVARVLASWRTSGQVGLLSALGSACWFTGFATAPVALVRVVGQVEVAFTMAFARIYLGERIRPAEVAGLLLVAAGVVLALLA